MSIDEKVKKVLILVNSDEYAGDITKLLKRMKCNYVRVYNITGAKVQLETYNFYAFICTRNVPLKSNTFAKKDAGIKYISKLLVTKPHIRYGYFGRYCDDDPYKKIIEQCVTLSAEGEVKLKPDLKKLIGDTSRESK